MSMTKTLTAKDPNIFFNEFQYVYPVVSRRSQGVSVGLNLNINNSCNWRCVYCQVPNLIKAKPPLVDLERMSFELDKVLEWILSGDFFTKHIPLKYRRLNDICIAGNGEPTLSASFLEVIKIIHEMRIKHNINDIKSILITNGSCIKVGNHIEKGILSLNELNGNVWFKVDHINIDKVKQLNNTVQNSSVVYKRVEHCCMLCPTYIQTCIFKYNGVPTLSINDNHFIDFMVSLSDKIKGVLLYSLSREAQQGYQVSAVDKKYLQEFANLLIANGVPTIYYE